MKKERGKLFIFMLVALTVAGFLLPFWPLSLVGIAALGFWGANVAAIMLALLLDIAWGVPPGTFETIALPFTLLAIVAMLARFLAERYLLRKISPKKLY